MAGESGGRREMVFPVEEDEKVEEGSDLSS